jgi:hypothetical protein
LIEIEVWLSIRGTKLEISHRSAERRDCSLQKGKKGPWLKKVSDGIHAYIFFSFLFISTPHSSHIMSGNDESLAQVFQKAEILFLDIQKSTLASNSDEYQVARALCPCRPISLI